MIDTFNKHLLDFDGHPVRKTRETLDDFAKELLQNDSNETERLLFRFRQFFSSYRVDETAYFQKTFDDFRTIIWDFVDQLAEDMGQEQKEDFEIRTNLEGLKEAVESNSINALKDRSRKFIDCYMEKQFKKDKRRSSRIKSIRKNLNTVKKQLVEAHDNLRFDHLTQAFNRKTFEETCSQYHKLFQVTPEHHVTVMIFDIDHFKKINDTYGHPVGDFVLKELIKSLKSVFTRESDMIARIGGEEFAVILPDYQVQHAMVKADEVLRKVRGEVFVHEDREIRFTVSIGVAELELGDDVSNWIKRADLALYQSKNTGRNQATAAPSTGLRVAG